MLHVKKLLTLLRFFFHISYFHCRLLSHLHYQLIVLDAKIYAGGFYELA